MHAAGAPRKPHTLSASVPPPEAAATRPTAFLPKGLLLFSRCAPVGVDTAAVQPPSSTLPADTASVLAPLRPSPAAANAALLDLGARPVAAAAVPASFSSNPYAAAAAPPPLPVPALDLSQRTAVRSIAMAAMLQILVAARSTAGHATGGLSALQSDMLADALSLARSSVAWLVTSECWKGKAAPSTPSCDDGSMIRLMVPIFAPEALRDNFTDLVVQAGLAVASRTALLLAPLRVPGTLLPMFASAPLQDGALVAVASTTVPHAAALRDNFTDLVAQAGLAVASRTALLLAPLRVPGTLLPMFASAPLQDGALVAVASTTVPHAAAPTLPSEGGTQQRSTLCSTTPVVVLSLVMTGYASESIFATLTPEQVRRLQFVEKLVQRALDALLDLHGWDGGDALPVVNDAPNATVHTLPTIQLLRRIMEAVSPGSVGRNDTDADVAVAAMNHAAASVAAGAARAV